MPAKDIDIPKVSSANTKKDMLEAYNLLKKRIKEQAEAELKPEKQKQKKSENAYGKVQDIAVQAVSSSHGRGTIPSGTKTVQIDPERGNAG